MILRVKWLLFTLIVLACLLLSYVFFVPPKLNGVILVPTKRWDSRITLAILPLIKLGSRIDDGFLRNSIDNLPWVDNAYLSFRNGILRIRIDEEKIAFAVLYRGRFYIIGRNHFVLDSVSTKPNIKIYAYSGNISPFEMFRGYDRLSNLFLTRLNIVKGYIDSYNPFDERPNVVITDTGVKLIYQRLGCAIYLGDTVKSWNNFLRFVKLNHKLKKGFYDFRFSSLLLVGGMYG
ncbi:MAG: hypothetical protein GWP10_14110 [Nitrospiraceae bacterium]|nr:hypothetical protein [Nitrospiraceae bacterium]